MTIFTSSQNTLGLALFCLVYFVALVFFNWNKCVNFDRLQIKESDNDYRFFFFFLILFSVCCSVSGDFFHYKIMVEDYDFSVGASNHGEEVYGIIIKFVEKNYLLFRTIVWGGALLVMRRVIKNYNIDIYNTLFFFCCLYFLTFANARASLAMSIYFWGISIILNKNGKTSKLIGMLLIVCSYFFHNSMIVAIGMSLICFMPFNRKIISSLFILLPVILLIFSRFVLFIVNDSTLFSDEELLSKYEFYSGRETAKANWRGILYEWLGYACFIIPFVIITYKLFFSNIQIIISNAILNLYKISFGLIFIAFLFLSLDIQGKVFFYRILFMTFIPISIMIGYLIEENIISYITYKRLVLFGTMCQLYKYLYSVYLVL